MPDPELIQAVQPVSEIPPDRGEEPTEDWGLCLSGGGYRAMLFHLGGILRLNEAGLLSRLSRISSVSGGSITAATLGTRWASSTGTRGPPVSSTSS
jgi:NTE family protein